MGVNKTKQSNLLFLSKRRNFGNPIHKQKNKKKSFTFQGSKPTFYINLTHHLHHFLLLNVKKKMIFHLQILRFKAKHAPYTIILTNGRDACKNMQKPTLQWKTWTGTKREEGKTIYLRQLRGRFLVWMENLRPAWYPC